MLLTIRNLVYVDKWLVQCASTLMVFSMFLVAREFVILIGVAPPTRPWNVWTLVSTVVLSPLVQEFLVRLSRLMPGPGVPPFRVSRRRRSSLRSRATRRWDERRR